MTNLPARAEGRRTKSTNGRNRESRRDYGATSSTRVWSRRRRWWWGMERRATRLMGPSSDWCRRRPRGSGRRTQLERAGTDLE